tara:strand:- start:47886 stop:49004 length:1119 start_codon:yes stop_codon:yes gene_type:complete
MIKWCRKCVLPNTRPNLIFDKNGVCNACKQSQIKKKINWQDRRDQFIGLIEKVKKKKNSYDCIIPVSGGKDSTWQVIKCLEYNLKPLAVTWKTPHRTKIGEDNLKNLINLGVDHIDFTINPQVESKLMYKSLKKFGTPLIPMHLAIYNLPVRIAQFFNISLIIWGENSAFEYGGKNKGFSKFINTDWIKNYGATNGTEMKDWISSDLSANALSPYSMTIEEKKKQINTIGVFLGYFFKWDPVEITKISKKNGFRYSKKNKKTGFYDFADIDDNLISIHHWLKWYKFGFTRSFDNLSIEIRNKRFTRIKALNIIKRIGNDKPLKDIKNFCDFVGISKNEFQCIAESHRNLKIWKKKQGVWKINNFIINDWDWK